jgi:hypothetical protein
MKDYQTHPDPSCYGIELRGGETVDDYIAKARGFNSTAEFREFRDASPERRKAIMRRDRDNSVDSDDEDSDRRRQLELLRITKDHQ